MKTIAITIDEETLARLDRLQPSGQSPRNRSRLIRAAVDDYLSRLERSHADAREALIVRRHRARLAKQAAAAVRAQAKP